MAPNIPEPTDAELQVLRVLWARGPSTVRDVHEALSRRKGTGYTTSLKLLQNMLGKGLVRRDERQRQHVYMAAVTEEATLRRLVRGLMDRAFDGSGAALAMQALDVRKVSPKEVAELKELLARIEQERQE